jgi:hypothetical protein
MSYLLEVQVPGAPAEEHELRLGSMKVGRGEAADLRIGALADHHLDLQVSADLVTVSVVGALAPLVFEGVPERRAAVPWGAEIFVEGVRLSFLATEQKRRTLHPLLALALCVAVVGLAWQGGAAASEAADASAVDPPPLLVPAVVCPEPDVARAPIRARAEEQAALAKQARYPFDPREGLEGLGRFQVALGCYEAAGDPAGTERARTGSEVLRKRLTEDLSSLRLQLDRALEQERFRPALSAVRELEALTAPLGDVPYVLWLRAQRRQLERKLEK